MKKIVRLLKRIKRIFRHKKPQWDCSESGIKNPQYTNSAYYSAKSLDLWEAKLNDICNVIYDCQNTYGERSWYRSGYGEDYPHDMIKIRKIVKNWDKCIKLTPIVLIYNGNNNLLIYDGNHRFSTCLLFYKSLKKRIPFLIDSASRNWIKQNIRSCKLIKTVLK